VVAKGTKHSVVVIALALAVLALASPGLAAPLRQEPRPTIVQPEQDAAVRGVVQLIGTAVHPQFQRYELYYAPWPVPSDQSWVFNGDAKYQPQPLGLLGTWDSRSVPDGAYALRVRVVKQDGNYLDSDPTRVLVVNTRPLQEPSATPTETSTPEPGPIVTEPTPAVTVVAPTVEISLPTPEVASTPLLEPTETPAAEATDEPVLATGEAPSDSGGFSATRLVQTARKSAMYTAGFFAAIAAFFVVKAALFWVWQRLRP